MRTRLFAAALLALGPALPAAAQVRAVVGTGGAAAVSVVPALTFGLSPSPLASAPVPFAPSAPGPAAPPLAPSAAPAPVFAIPAPAVFAPVPSAAALSAAASRDGEAGKARRPGVARSFQELGRLLEEREGASGARLFDGAAAEKPLDASVDRPAGAFSVSVVRVRSSEEAERHIPSTPNTRDFLRELRGRWSAIGWLDLRLYRDAFGGGFRAVDLSGRPGLVDELPEVAAHEAALIKRIQLHVDDLQLVLREEGKTPDLVVAGVVTEMKSLYPAGDLAVQLGHASAQLLSHSRRHGLGPGAVAVDLVGRERVPVAEVRRAINAYAAANELGFDRVEIYAGADRKVFARGEDGSFGLRRGPAPAAPRSAARFLVPDALGLAPAPDREVLLREITEPAKRLRAAGVKATVTVYGSARIQAPARARAELDALLKKHGRSPRGPAARGRLDAARQAVAASKYYEIARRFGEIVAENGGGEVAVVTGGGPGIMEAANRGAFEAGGPSVGYNIKLDKEQGLNPYATAGLDFEFQHFATRKMALRHGAMALVYFPGGFGTMDELFEVLTLMQTGKMGRVPIVLVGEKDYWDKILDFGEFSRMGLVSPGDLSLFRFADTAQDAWRAIIAPAASS